MVIKVNIMDNGSREKNKVKACIFTSIKMCIQASGKTVKNMVMELMSSPLQG